MTPWLAQRAQGLRAAAWAILAVLFCSRGVIALLDLPVTVDIVLTAGLSYLLPMALALCVFAPLALRTRGAIEHRLWGMLFIALGSVLLAELYYTWHAITVDAVNSWLLVPVRVLHAVGALSFLSIVGMLTVVGDRSYASRVRAYLDVAAAALAVTPLIYALWTYPAMGALPGRGVGVAVTTAFYPVFGMAMLVGTIAAMVGWKAARWRAWERISATGLGVYSFSLIVFPWWFIGGGAAFRARADWFTALLGLGVLLLFVGAVYRATSPKQDGLIEAWPMASVPMRRLGQVYPVLMTLALPMLGFLAYSMPPAGARPVGVCAFLLALVLIAQSGLVALDRVRTEGRSARDPFSGALTRPELSSNLDHAVTRATEAGLPLSIVLFSAGGSDRYDSVVGGAREASVIATALAAEAPDGRVYAAESARFVMVIEDADAYDAAAIARRAWIRTSRAVIDAGLSHIQIAAGIAALPTHALDATHLMRCATVALGAAEGADDEPVVIYDETLNAVATEEYVSRARMRTLRATVRALAEAVDARDPATRHHSVHVAELATALGQVMDLPDDRVQIVGLAALMHDVGKIGIRDEVLLKEDRLTEEERAEIEEHVVLSERILAPAHLDEVLPLVRYHHERWDGKGYPEGLLEHEIPLEARILAVCDAFETMTTGRPYRAARSTAEALAELEACAGAQFDPLVTATFVRMIRRLDAGPTWVPQSTVEVAMESTT